MIGPLVEELLPAPEPLRSCERLLGRPYLLLLDSAARSSDLGRYSFLCCDPALVVRSRGTATEIVSTGDGVVRAHDGDALGALRELLGPPAEPVAGLPPFQGGAAGFIGYDWGATLERLPLALHDDYAHPDVVLGVYDWVLAWDHVAGRAWLISTGLPEHDPVARAGRAAARLAEARRWLDAGPPAAAPHAPSPPGRPGRVAAPTFPVEARGAPPSLRVRSTFTHEAYVSAVSRVREYVRAGDIFQANLSQRLDAPLEGSTWAFYRRLRTSNPASFAAFLAFPEAHVISASPELFLRLAYDGTVETRPIKGTRPRGAGPEHDALLGQALRESLKDRAENLMIVDLLRNDLSRVCAPRSVRAPELFALQSHPTVHHLVSTVVGRLSPGVDAAALLRATFPGGSITGAPKVRAMEIIAELEPTRRGVYCGTIGYLSVTGALDTSIVIRTSVVQGDRVYFSVGGGIVADSDPEQEYRETLDKAAATIAALRVPPPPIA